ncbi:hypothetical protein K502DRAFT_349510 [Neoconidiobolus thromboides FSU 785]|nr:hypothetical protein K502DRAFT_349510 [Neoconidiobolus thromboides FSU 785]
MFKSFLLLFLSLYFVTGSKIIKAGTKIVTEVAKDMSHRYVVGKMEDQTPKPNTDAPKFQMPKPTKLGVEYFNEAGVKLGTEVAKDLAHRYVVGKAEDQIPKPKTNVPKLPVYKPTKLGVELFNKYHNKKFGKRWVKKIVNSL